MPLTTKWIKGASPTGVAVPPPPLAVRRPVLPKKDDAMPSRGYRKGISDTKEPVDRFIRSRMTTAEHAAVQAEATSRSITVSKLVRNLVRAHLEGRRLEAPHERGHDAALIRELARCGNNLNQLAKQANVGAVPVSETELRAALNAIIAVIADL